MSVYNNHSAYFFCGHDNLLGGQFWAMGRFNLLGGLNSLLSVKLPTQLTCYLPPCSWLKCSQCLWSIYVVKCGLCLINVYTIDYYSLLEPVAKVAMSRINGSPSVPSIWAITNVLWKNTRSCRIRTASIPMYGSIWHAAISSWGCTHRQMKQLRNVVQVKTQWPIASIKVWLFVWNSA